MEDYIALKCTASAYIQRGFQKSFTKTYESWKLNSAKALLIKRQIVDTKENILKK